VTAQETAEILLGRFRNTHMIRDELITQLLVFFRKEFEIENPGLDDDLREKHGFDSIDAIELLLNIEKMLGYELTQEEKKQAMDIRTINQICDYIESLARTRPALPSGEASFT
jgi:acyl carrier protein